MSLQSPLRIHIAPQGFEDERIYKPAIEHKADKVVLLVTDDDTQSNECQERVENALEEEGIDCENRECNIFDPNKSLQTISNVINEHPDDDVKVNISTGSKITAIGGMFACMMTGATPYYVRAEDYGDEPVSKGMKKTIQVPTYPIDPPKERYVEVLSYLQKMAEDGEEVNISNVNDFVQEQDMDIVEDIDRQDDTNIYDIINREIIDPLVNRNYIRKREFGGSKILTLTETGEQTLEFSRHLLENE